jgi:hypothetical protein
VNIAEEVAAAGAGFVVADTLDGTVAGLTSWLNLNTEAQARMSQKAQQLFWDRFEIHRAHRSLLDVLRHTPSHSDHHLQLTNRK